MPNKKKEHAPSYNESMYGADLLKPKQCKDCLFRDKTTVKLDGKTLQVGATKSVCGIFEYPDGKPMGVMKNMEECEYYEKE